MHNLFRLTKNYKGIEGDGHLVLECNFGPTLFIIKIIFQNYLYQKSLHLLNVKSFLLSPSDHPPSIKKGVHSNPAKDVASCATSVTQSEGRTRSFNRRIFIAHFFHHAQAKGVRWEDSFKFNFTAQPTSTYLLIAIALERASFPLGEERKKKCKRFINQNQWCNEQRYSGAPLHDCTPCDMHRAECSFIDPISADCASTQTMVWKLDACAFSQLRIVPISTVSERTEQTARRTLSLNHNPPWWPQPALALCIRLAFEFQRPSAKQLLFGNSCRDNLFSSLFCFAAQMQFEECERPFELFFEEGKKSACNITRSAWHINFYDKRIRTAQCIQR